MYKNIQYQILFWLLIGGGFVGSSLSMMRLNDAIYSSFIILLIFVIAFYINILYLFPNYYKETKNYKYFFLCLLIILGCTVFAVEIEYNFFFPKFNHHRHGPNPRFMMATRDFCWLTIIMVGSSLYKIQERMRKYIVESNKLKEERLQTELKLLKSQINPHFLFNALNNIYSLSYTKSEKAPDSILQLSNMLRYIIEDCAQETVPLKSEYEYLINYIAFQQLKSEHKMNITFHYNPNCDSIKVAPMLLIPFIENSFKYSMIEENEQSFITISLLQSEQFIIFHIENSVPEQSIVKSGGKLGINNVKQRLNLIYPDKHSLSITHKQSVFVVDLCIEYTNN